MDSQRLLDCLESDFRRLRRVAGTPADIASSVEYTLRPYRPATRRAIVDLPAPLPPPIQ